MVTTEDKGEVRRGACRARQKGFTYVWIMFVVALTGITLAAAGQVWRTEARREKEKELMFVGDQFRQAIGLYYESSPEIPRRYPDSLEKLLLDNRFPAVKRHLRKIYFDPMTGSDEWGLIRRPGIGIVGVYSLSTQAPVKKTNFHARDASFKGAESYRDWKFIYSPGASHTGPQLAPQPVPQPQSQSGLQTPPGPGQEPEAEIQPVQPEQSESQLWDPFFRREPSPASSDPTAPAEDFGAQLPSHFRQDGQEQQHAPP
jgi:type II secretory pathway pseudopilin PulG